MRPLPRLAAVLLLLGISTAHAASWFGLDALSAASGLGIEVDTDSLRQSGPRREIAVRVTYPEPRLHRWGAPFRSVVATVEFECEGRLGGYRDAVFYSDVKGQGLVTVREDGQSAAVPERTRDLLPAKSLEVLARAACSRPTPAVK
jgi:hypothetical protein